MPSGGGNMALAFAGILAGSVIIDYGVKNTRQAFAGNGSAPGGDTGNAVGVGNFPKSVNPVPGAKVSRADQGIDATGRDFVSPWAGTVVKATSNDPGWNGGGYVAVQSRDNPDFVYYVAEGISAIVREGQTVNAGDRLGYPVANPYNGIIGNVEFGRADPHNPARPLAQAVSDARSMVLDFVRWFEALGGARPTSLASAGSA